MSFEGSPAISSLIKPHLGNTRKHFRFFWIIANFYINSNRNTSRDSGHEDAMDDEDENDGIFPNVSLFSVAMMMMKKVRLLPIPYWVLPN